MGFSRKEYWRGLPFPAARVFLIQGSNTCLLHLLDWKADSLPLHHLELPSGIFSSNESVIPLCPPPLPPPPPPHKAISFFFFKKVYTHIHTHTHTLMYLCIYLFISGWNGSLSLHRASSSCSQQGLLSGRGTRASHCSGFSYCCAQALGPLGFSSCGSWVLQHRLNRCGAQAP